MKDHLLQLALAEPTERRPSLTREYLQVQLLRLLQGSGAMAQLAFIGGTALRLLHRLPRFSEDLDFLVAPGRKSRLRLDPARVYRDLDSDLSRAGYTVTVKPRSKRNVSSAFVRFEGLPRDAGWSRDPRLAVSIRLEIDTRPPAGGTVETTLIQRFFPVALRHHDLPSLFAGKLHALLARPYAKGRDWFDLVWYLTEQRGLEPNGALLSNALRQSGHDALAASDWRDAVAVRLRRLDWKLVLADLRPFVERQSDLDVIAPELILSLLSRRG